MDLRSPIMYILLSVHFPKLQSRYVSIIHYLSNTKLLSLIPRIADYKSKQIIGAEHSLLSVRIQSCIEANELR